MGEEFMSKEDVMFNINTLQQSIIEMGDQIKELEVKIYRIENQDKK